LQIREQTLGREHPDLAFSLNGLANLYTLQGKQKQAEPLYERALFIREQHLSQYHPETAQTLHDLASFHQKQGYLSEALSFAERALSIRSRSLGDTHSKTVTSRTLYTQLRQEQEWQTQEKPPEQCAEETANQHREEQERKLEGAPILSQETANPSASNDNDDPLQAFLDACCERHPRAWCRSADLWQAYERWAEGHQERYTLSRGAFIAQLKAHGCCTDRTKTARIWRGIALVKKEW
jgi:tetratricopeptide (TPR) repeat protein